MSVLVARLNLICDVTAIEAMLAVVGTVATMETSSIIGALVQLLVETELEWRPYMPVLSRLIHVRLPHVTAASKPAPEKETVGCGAAHGEPLFRSKKQECDGLGGASALVVWGVGNECPRRGGRWCGGGFFHGGFPESVQALVKLSRKRLDMSAKTH